MERMQEDSGAVRLVLAVMAMMSQEKSMSRRGDKCIIRILDAAQLT